MKTGSLLPVSAGSNGDHGHRDGLVGALRVRDGTAARSRVRQWGGGGGGRTVFVWLRAQTILSLEIPTI